MGKFNHNFNLIKSSDTCRIYACDGNIVRLDFVNDSCIRVAVYKNENDLLPTFSVNPSNELLTAGRDRLSTDGFNCASLKFT